MAHWLQPVAAPTGNSVQTAFVRSAASFSHHLEKDRTPADLRPMSTSDTPAERFRSILFWKILEKTLLRPLFWYEFP